jgi:hypothetical protein
VIFSSETSVDFERTTRYIRVSEKTDVRMVTVESVSSPTVCNVKIHSRPKYIRVIQLIHNSVTYTGSKRIVTSDSTA